MHRLVRCKHERKCSRTREEDTSFTDVKIKIPYRNLDQGMWVTSCTTNVGWDLIKSSELCPASERESWHSDLGEARRLCALRASCVGWVESWRCKSSHHRNIVYHSPHVEKPLNSKKVNKSFPYVYFTHPDHGYVTFSLLLFCVSFLWNVSLSLSNCSIYSSLFFFVSYFIRGVSLFLY